MKTWKVRWFVLKGTRLYYFKSKEVTKPQGVISLHDTVLRAAPEKARPFCFTIRFSIFQILLFDIVF
jgi:hypothetical protein